MTDWNWLRPVVIVALGLLIGYLIVIFVLVPIIAG